MGLFYAYWKEDKKLRKLYVGKNLEDFRLRKLAKEIKLRPSQLIKLKFIQQKASKDNVLAKQHLEKLKKEEVSIDWAYRVLINRIRQRRMLKMMTIADNRHFSYDNEIYNLRKGRKRPILDELARYCRVKERWNGYRIS